MAFLPPPPVTPFISTSSITEMIDHKGNKYWMLLSLTTEHLETLKFSENKIKKVLYKESYSSNTLTSIGKFWEKRFHFLIDDIIYFYYCNTFGYTWFYHNFMRTEEITHSPDICGTMIRIWPGWNNLSLFGPCKAKAKHRRSPIQQKLMQ